MNEDLTCSNSLSNFSSMYFCTCNSFSSHWLSNFETLSCNDTNLILYKTIVHAASARSTTASSTTSIVRAQAMHGREGLELAPPFRGWNPGEGGLPFSTPVIIFFTPSDGGVKLFSCKNSFPPAQSQVE